MLPPAGRPLLPQAPDGSLERKREGAAGRRGVAGRSHLPEAQGAGGARCPGSGCRKPSLERRTGRSVHCLGPYCQCRTNRKSQTEIPLQVASRGLVRLPEAPSLCRRRPSRCWLILCIYGVSPDAVLARFRVGSMQAARRQDGCGRRNKHTRSGPVGSACSAPENVMSV